MTGVSPKIPKPEPANERAERNDSTVAWLVGYIVWFLVAYKWIIAAGVAVAFAMGLNVTLGIPPWGEWPRWVRLMLVGGIGAIVVAWIPAKKVYKAYFTIPFERLNEVDALRDINRPYDITPDVWDEREVVEGEPYQNADGEWVCRRVEWTGDKLKLWGDWRGEATQTELMTWEYAIEETQGRQRFWTQVGKSLKAKLPFYLRSLEQSIYERVVRKTLKKTTDTFDLYEDEVVESAEITVDSLDVPEGYYSDDFAEEVESELGGMIDDDTGGAWSAVTETGESSGVNDE